MKLRLRYHLKNPRTASIEERANIHAYNLWQIALSSAKMLHAEDYVYDHDHQRVVVIMEWLVFLAHITDRFCYARLNNEQRTQFITTLAHDSARQVQRNSEEVLGSGDYQAQFFELINSRFTEYAQSNFTNDEPSYGLYRSFGAKVRDVMGHDQTNKWVFDQIMDKDGPAMVEKTKTSLDAVLSHEQAPNTSSTELLLNEPPIAQ